MRSRCFGSSGTFAVRRSHRIARGSVAGRDALAAAGDCFAFVTVKNSGHDDLFAPFAVFLVPSLGFSAASIGLKFWLLKRRAVRRTAKLQGLQLQARQSRRIDFRLLCDRFVLHRRQQRHEELKSTNDAARYQAYTYIALALIEVCASACLRL